jgi:L-alanine-DL-glutamate epimerase-like enolase superfamily enzyme
MKITEISTRRVRISREDWFAPHPIPVGEVPYYEFPLSTLHTDVGIDGYTMDFGARGQGRGSAYLLHDVYYHDLIGRDPLNHEQIWQSLRRKKRHLYNITEAIWSNIDVALWDIKGKVAGMPIAVLLGKFRDKVPLYGTCPPQTIGSVEEVELRVREKIQQGFAGVKLQLSGGSKLDIPRLRRAREVAGAGYPLMLDSSAVLSFEDALKIGFELDELEYEWFEEPFPDRHIFQLKKLAQNIKTPVLAGETVSLMELPQYLIDGAVDLVRGDVHIKSGISGLMKAIGMCELMGFELEIHTAATPLLDIANLHVGCATHLSRFLESHHPIFRFGLKGNPLAVGPDGCQHVPSGPGLGVDIDWDWIDDHTVEIIRGCEY